MGTLFYREKRLFALAILVVVALGSAALATIGRQEDPTITNLFATVVTPFPGADPARVEALVTEPIEEELETIAEIDEISSTSRSGISVVRVELSAFIDEVTIEQSWSRVRDALSDAARRFPQGVPEPEFDEERTGAFTAISAITASPGRDVPLSLLGRLAEELQDRLRALPGTDLVRLYGESEEEILVTVDPHRLASLGLQVDAVAGAVARADSKIEAGRVRGSATDFLIEVRGEIDALQRVREIPVASADGAVTRLGDIAAVQRSVREPAATEAYANADRAVVVAIRMEPGLQVDAWMARVRGVMRAVEAGLPAGVEHRLLFDQTTYTIERLGEVSRNLLIGMTLVVAVLFLTMGARSALIVAVMLPLTSLLSLFVLQTLGVSIHQMSVTGLIVALGLLVDGAIVMTDEIRKRLAAGVERAEAVGQGVRRLRAPLLASTLTTVLAFTPMALLPGPAGDFVGAIAIAVMVMLVTSLLLALTITPALAGFLLPAPSETDKARGFWHTGVEPGRVGRLFRRSLERSLRYPALGILTALALPLMGFGAFATLTAQFFPGVDRDQFYVQMHLPDGASIAATRAVSEEIDARLRAHPGIEGVHWFLGESAPAFYYNMMMDQDGVRGFAEALITATDARSAARLVASLQPELDAAVPDAQVIVRWLVQGPPVAAPVEMRLVGPELATLRSLGEEARALMAEVPSVVHTRATLQGGAPKLVVDLDEDEVRLAGLELSAVAEQLDALLEGATGGSLVEGSEQLPVRVRVAGQDRSDAERVRSTLLVPTGVTATDEFPGIPIEALGQVRVEPSDSPIARRNGERVNIVQAHLQPGVLPEEALMRVKSLLDASPLSLPPGYRIEWGGDSDARAETVTNLFASVGIIVVAFIATIVVTFNSFRRSLVALLVCPLSAGLSFLALAIFGHPFGIQALIGVIGAIGVSINAAIIIISACQLDPRAARGDADAIAGIVERSSRHIVSTTVTTVGGFLPLILAGGGFWPPFAMAIAGGVLLSAVISFYFVPPLLLLLTRERRAIEGEERRTGAAAHGLVPA